LCLSVWLLPPHTPLLQVPGQCHQHQALHCQHDCCQALSTNTSTASPAHQRWP